MTIVYNDNQIEVIRFPLMIDSVWHQFLVFTLLCGVTSSTWASFPRCWAAGTFGGRPCGLCLRFVEEICQHVTIFTILSVLHCLAALQYRIKNMKVLWLCCDDGCSCKSCQNIIIFYLGRASVSVDRRWDAHWTEKWRAWKRRAAVLGEVIVILEVLMLMVLLQYS